MAVTIRREAARLRASTGELELEIDLATLALSLAAPRYGLRLDGARPCAVVNGRRREAVAARLDGHGEIRTRCGVATRIQLRAAADDALELSLAVDLADGWPGIALELALENRGAARLEVESLDALAWERGPARALELPGMPDLAFFRLGYQSWSPAGWVRLGARERRARLDLVRRIACGPHTPEPRAGLHVSDFAAVLRAPGRAGLTLGFTTHERFLSHIALERDALGMRQLAARLLAEGAILAPRGTLRAERLWVGLDAPDADGLATWAERCGLEMSAPVPARVPSGWCSWYHYFTRVTAADIEKNIDALAPLRGELDAIQIDDGWQAAIGDWQDFDPDFPHGVAPLARRIRDAGFRAGIWLAPFLVSRAARTAREHPDWLLRDAGGRPVVAMLNPAWKGRVCHALDPTHPRALAWLAEVIGALREQGFDWFKLDFLYAAALPGERHERLPSAAAYRRGLGALREAAGDALLVGCGAPLGPSVGLVDAMRIGPDVAPYWAERPFDRLIGNLTAPSARSSLRNVLARAALHQRLWLNDPDCVLLRDVDTKLEPVEVDALAATIAVSGGLVLASDDWTEVIPSRRELLRRMLPAIGRTPRVDESGAEIPDGLSVAFPDGSVLVLRVNLEERPRAFELELASFGLEGAVRVYDVLGDRDLGVAAERRLRTASVPAHGALLLRLTPEARLPGLVGSTLHLAGGALEAARLRRGTDGGALVKLRLPGARRGRILVARADGVVVPVRVGFEDELELEVLGEALPS